MLNPSNTGAVSPTGDLSARDIITGLQIENLTIVLQAVDDLTGLLNQPDLRFQHSEAAGLALFSGEEPLLALPPNLLQAIKRLPREATRGLTPSERHRLYAAGLVTRQPLSPPQRVAARQHYIPLPGHTSWDRADDVLQPGLCYMRVTGQGAERRIEREELADVAAAVGRFPAFVLLGPPGCGKSTVLERLAYTTARDFLADPSLRLPLWVTLAEYDWQQQLPLAFIRERWLTLVADDFVDLARTGRLLLLADGLNEMRRLSDPADLPHRVADWRRFIEEFFAEDTAHGSRAILASRDADDYEHRLGLPRVEIDRLEAGQIAAFARAYLGDEADPFLADLERLGLTELAEVPFSLYALTQQYDRAHRRLPRNRGQLFREYADDLLRVMYKHQDRERLAAGQALAELGYTLQEAGEGTVLPAAALIDRLPAQVSLPGRRRRPVTFDIDAEALFERAWRAGLLSQVSGDDDTFKFSHQLLQEQFAGQRLLQQWQQADDAAARWRTARTPAEMPPPEAGEWDPLPPPPATHWDRPTILAAGMLEQADPLVGAVLAANPALAGRCLSEGSAAVSDDTRAAVQRALLADLTNPELHRRTRLQAGRLLAQVGDPRLEPVTLNGVAVILPPLVHVPGGLATLGSNDSEAYDDEQPVHQVEVGDFWLGQHPVTNAEYGCFIEAGGYDEASYWTAEGWQWRQGQLETSGAVENVMELYRALVDNPGLLDQLLAEGRWPKDDVEQWRGLIQLPAEQVREMAASQFGQRRTDQPYWWDDAAYNQVNQPVVGVTWYEAAAYCAWLTDVIASAAKQSPETNAETATALRPRGDIPDDVIARSAATWQSPDSDAETATALRPRSDMAEIWRDLQSQIQNGKSKIALPSEAEWEWAAGGPEHHRYPWGAEFDSDLANTLEGRVLGTSAVGAYPAGAATCGARDMAGNVYEWTRSQFRDYPYRQDDGREDGVTGTDVRMTLRGGSWVNSQRYARVSTRTRDHPDNFDDNSGFRLVVSPIFKVLISDFWKLVAVSCFLAQANSVAKP
ncbi:MAG: hypothetical protein Kow0031_29270 [Anaerolineae bacterium]